jgi:ferredoxin
MPKLTIENEGEWEVELGKRLVLAMKECGIDQLHACGGNGKCTTCKVEFISGEPNKITEAEKETLENKGLSGVRLSCQLCVEEDMNIKAISRLKDTDRPGPGAEPEEHIEPEPVWLEKV